MIPHYFPPYFINIEEVVLSSLIKILEWHRSFWFGIFNGGSHVIFTVGFSVWNEFEFMGIKSQNESLGKSFYSLSFNFKKFQNHSVSHNRSHNKHNHLFNITFQNLEFWDVTFPELVLRWYSGLSHLSLRNPHMTCIASFYSLHNYKITIGPGTTFLCISKRITKVNIYYIVVY